MGQHWTGPRGVLQYKRVQLSRLAGKLAWTRWARAFAGVAGRAALGTAGAVLGAGELAYYGYKAYKAFSQKQAKVKDMVRRVKRRAGKIRRRNRMRPVKRAAIRKRVPRRKYGKRRRAMEVAPPTVPRKRARREYAPVGAYGGEYGGVIKKSVTLVSARPIPKKELKLSYNHRILRWQRVNDMEPSSTTIPGALALIHQSTADVPTKTITPCYLMCLNHTCNQAAITTVGPFYQLRFTDTGNVELAQINTQNADATITQPKWVVEHTSPAFNSGNTDPELRFINNAWYDIRMNCYGATAQPTEYDISVVSFPEGYLDPLETPSSAQEAADRHATFQSMVQRFMANPILPMNVPKRKYKVHAKIRFRVQPTLTIENDTTPANRVVRLFVRDGSTYDYCYHGDGFSGAGADDKLSTVQFVTTGATGSGDYSDFPQARARKWLLIRALNGTRTASGGETRANAPSFDIVVRKGEYMAAR